MGLGGRPGALGGRALLMARQFLQTRCLTVRAGSGRVSLQEGQTKVLKGGGLGLGGGVVCSVDVSPGAFTGGAALGAVGVIGDDTALAAVSADGGLGEDDGHGG